MARFPAGVLLPLLAAALWAQPQVSPSRSAPKAKSSSPDSGAISQGVYHNHAFDFSYKLPFGWVDRTTDMQDDSADDLFKSRLLLAIFERPPEASGDTINSAVVIAVEPLPAGMSTASDYFESLAALTTAKGFQANEPQELSVGNVKLLRGDFTKPRGTLTMRQTSLVLVQRSQAVSFTFIGGSEDEMNELIERLSFTSRKPGH